MNLPRRLALATGNADKRAEWARRLPGIELVEVDLPSPVEDAADYVGNALIKARAAAAATGLPALGDDVGLEVDALGGRPGLETRRWAEALGGWVAARSALPVGSGATYACGLALAWPDGTVQTALGTVRGLIVPARGEGPGFEPCFVPEGDARTLAELGPSDPSHHRSRALTGLTRPPTGVRYTLY